MPIVVGLQAPITPVPTLKVESTPHTYCPNAEEQLIDKRKISGEFSLQTPLREG